MDSTKITYALGLVLWLVIVMFVLIKIRRYPGTLTMLVILAQSVGLAAGIVLTVYMTVAYFVSLPRLPRGVSYGASVIGGVAMASLCYEWLSKEVSDLIRK